MVLILANRSASNICSVAGCGSKLKPLYRFPRPTKDRIRFQQWVYAAHNPRYAELTDDQIARRGFICQKHFEAKYFVGLRRLVSYAVPTLNLHPDVEGTAWDGERATTGSQVLCSIEAAEDPSNRQVVESYDFLQNFDSGTNLDVPGDAATVLRGSLFRDPSIVDSLLPESDQGSISDEDIILEICTEVVDIVTSPVPDRDENFDNDTELDENSTLLLLDATTNLENCAELDLDITPQVPDLENCTSSDQNCTALGPDLRNDCIGLETSDIVDSHSDVFERRARETIEKTAIDVAPRDMEKPYFKSVKSFSQDNKSIAEVCRICFESLEAEDVIKLYEESSEHDPVQLKKLLRLVLPELDLEIYSNAVICVRCAELVVYSYQLKEKWLSTEEKLEQIIEKNKGMIERDADLIIIGERVQKGESETDHDYTGTSPCEQSQEKECTEAQLRSLALQSEEKLSTNVSLLYGNFDTNDLTKVKKEMKNLEPCICEHCGCMFKYRRQLMRHLKVHDGPPKQRKQQERKIMCEICGQLYTSPLRLKMHKKTHSGYKCTACEKVFSKWQQLRLHRISHNPPSSHQCNLCGKQYPRKTSLNLHMKSHDPANKKIVCHICNKKYLFLHSLRTHLRRHTKEASFKCDYCERSMKYENSLRKHIRIFHLDEAKHVCEFCDKPYWKKCDLDKHRLRVHRRFFAEQEVRDEEHCAVESIQEIIVDIGGSSIFNM